MVHANMKNLIFPLTAKGEEYGYTLIELLMVVVLISVLTGTFLSSQSSSFVSYSKLRLAAAELAGAMAKARDTAARNINVVDSVADICSIKQTVDSTTTNVTTALDPANCINSSLLPNAINIRSRSGLSTLNVDQTTVFTFRSEGMSTNPDTTLTDQTVRLSDSRSPTIICVNLTNPASIIRLGLVKAGATSCDYTAK
jgi:prepilin-type N-terminal cleavage/methylation domain-containing protein